MSEFLAMGGYAQYVWTAFGVSFFALLALYWMTQRTFRQAQQRTRRFVQSMQDDRS
jgi:heme exporter protein D